MGTDKKIIAVTNGRGITNIISLGFVFALSATLIIVGIHENLVWILLLGVFFGVIFLYFTVSDLVNNREIFFESSKISAQVNPIPIFEKYKEYEAKKIRYCRAISKHYSGPGGITGRNHYVGISIKGDGKGLERFVIAKNKKDAERLSGEIDKFLHTLQSGNK